MTKVREQSFRLEHVMGMPISIDLAEADSASVRDALERCFRQLHRIDEVFSTYREDSEISRIGRRELAVDDATSDVREVLDLCEQVRIATNGHFDIFSAAQVGPARLIQGEHAIETSGLVKGWAIDRVATELQRSGIANFCINAGGDVFAKGKPAADMPWRIGIQNPNEAGEVVAVVDANDVAVATSGRYARGEHIVGDGAADLISVTVIGADVVLADAYATAVMAMGVAGIDWLAHQPGFEIFAIDSQNQMHYSPSLDAILTL